MKLHNLLAGILSSILLSYPVYGDSGKELDMIAEGGRLYDKWWREYALPKPGKTHPAYPAEAKQKGADTWRCKECHGWDYRGREGVYSKGSHHTGFKGIADYAGRDTAEILQILKDETHKFDSVMREYGLLRLALFVAKGQADISQHVDAETGKVAGNTDIGKRIYRDNCIRCHGATGQHLNFGDATNPEYVGTVAGKNPWEAIHKIRNGHPGAFMMGKPMPNMNKVISFNEQLDLLAFLQTLPE